MAACLLSAEGPPWIDGSHRVILATGDQVAIDIHGVRLLQNCAAVNDLVGNAWDLPQIKTAVKHGLGIRNDGEFLPGPMK